MHAGPQRTDVDVYLTFTETRVDFRGFMTVYKTPKDQDSHSVHHLQGYYQYAGNHLNNRNSSICSINTR